MKNQKTAIAIIIMAMVCIISIWENCSTRLRENQTREIADETLRKENQRLEKLVQSYFISNTALHAKIDSAEAAAKIIQPKRQEVKKKWSQAIAEAPKDTTTKKLNNIHNESEVLCDSVIDLQQAQIDYQKKIIANDSSIIFYKDSIQSMTTDIVLDQEDVIKKQKRKLLFNKILTGTLTGALILALLLQ